MLLQSNRWRRAKINNSFKLISDDPEYLMAMSVINAFRIKNCIYMKNDSNEKENVENVKKFSIQSIMTKILSYEELLEYLKIGLFPNVKTIITMREKKLIKLVEFFQILQKVSSSH
jgi:hypothetical protein